MPPKTGVIAPGSTLGIFGGGQLGRMTAIEARHLGYGVHIFDPEPAGPASEVADVEVNADYNDLEAVSRFASGADVISYEFENVPFAAVEAAAAFCPVRPRGEVLHICQNREREKQFLKAHGIPCAPFNIIDSAESLAAAMRTCGPEGGVLKTADFGYDGKGQIRVQSSGNPAEIWNSLNAQRAVFEKWIAFEKEISVVCARGVDGRTGVFPVAENIHSNHILDWSIVPARVSPDVAAQACETAHRVASELDVVGLVTVEFFVTGDNQLLVNELAPRPHNSGHFSLDACVTSQFEQHVRAVCGLPFGSFALLSPVVMGNLLGELWHNGPPDWCRILENENASLHLYGKRTPRTGRKMGHFCVMNADVETAIATAGKLRRHLEEA